MGSSITESSLLPVSDNCTQHTRGRMIRVNAVTSVLLLMHKDDKLQQIMYLFKEDIDNIIQQVLSLQIDASILYSEAFVVFNLPVICCLLAPGMCISSAPNTYAHLAFHT
ncbi:hypothetical protein Fmac_032480 [Flemingia macrophylla]|uniref:Uncharacterized protein n=1 Tax=Flemingia macrophylla TaxID=520843 RepID=A0ABD1L518_9FABA